MGQAHQRYIADSSPMLDQPTELFSPIAQVVHPDDIPAAALMQISQEAPNDCASKMASMERLRNVGT